MNQEASRASLTSQIDNWLQACRKIAQLKQQRDKLCDDIVCLRQERDGLHRQVKGMHWIWLTLEELEQRREDARQLQQELLEAGGKESLQRKREQLIEERATLEAALAQLEALEELAGEFEKLEEHLAEENTRAVQVAEMLRIKRLLDTRKPEEMELIHLARQVKDLQEKLDAATRAAHEIKAREETALKALSTSTSTPDGLKEMKRRASEDPDELLLGSRMGLFPVRRRLGEFQEQTDREEASLAWLVQDVENLQARRDELTSDLAEANRILRDPDVLAEWETKLEEHGVEAKGLGEEPRDLESSLKEQVDYLERLRQVLDEEDENRRKRHISIVHQETS